MKKIIIVDRLYLMMCFFAILAFLILITIFFNGFENSFVGISRLGIAIAFIINYFASSKNRIKAIMINDNTITFETIKYLRKNTITIERNKIIDLTIFLYPTNSNKIDLQFCLRNNIKNEYIDIRYDKGSRSVIKQLFVLKDYIPAFSYQIYPENNYSGNSLKQYIKNNFKNSLKDNICNIIIFCVCFFAILLLIALFFSIKYIN